MLWLALACGPAPDPSGSSDCPEDCAVTVQIEPPSGPSGTLIVRSDPPGYAFGGAVLDPSGAEIATVSGLSEAEVPLSGLIPGETYTVSVGYACVAGEAQPACGDVELRFAVGDATGTTGGTTPTDGSVTDAFVQEPSPLVDVLFVVDNSGSMAVHQSDLTANFPVFASFFLGSGLDYHIGVVSTDLADPRQSGKLREVAGARWIDDATPDPIAVFGAMANLGTTGSGTEAGFGAAYTAIELLEPGYNAGFVRDGSNLHVILLSDEPDQTPPSVIADAEFVPWLEGLRTDLALTTFSTICTRTGPTRGTAYIDAAFATGGVAHDIENVDYGLVLEDLGLASSGLAREFFLTEVPEPGTLEVTVEDPTTGAELSFTEGDDYLYDEGRNSVAFVSYVPVPGATVRVHYWPIE
ncbi:MAG: vWA domain-containing protein [Myxococcota bacterium]